MRPTILGTVVRRIDLHSDQDSSDKDYRISISMETGGGCHVYTEYGPAGKLNHGQEVTSSPISIASAGTIANDLRDKKVKGKSRYRVVADQSFPHPGTPSPAATAPSTPAPAVRRRPGRPTSETLSPRSLAQYKNLF